MKRFDRATVLAFAKRVPWLEVAILAVSFAVLVTLGIANIREKEDAVQNLDSYSSYDAKSGGYRGWHDLLAREGIDVARFEERPAFLDHSIATLVYAEPLIFDPRQNTVTKNDINVLEGWVRAGGHLLYIGHDDIAASQNVLALPRSNAKKSDVKNSKAAAQSTSGPSGKGPPGVIVASDLARYAIAHLDVRERLRYLPTKASRVLVADPKGAIVLRYAYGHGSVTTVIDEALFSNARLAVADHARLAYALVASQRSGSGTGSVAFDEDVHGYEAPLHWWDLVPRALVISFALGVLALAVAIVGGAIRLGPPLVALPRDDRTSADFIESVAALYSRGRAIRKALLDAWASSKRAVAARVGLPDDAPVQDIAARVEGSQAKADFVALERVATNAFPDDTNLLRGMTLAQRLRKEFATHGRTGR